MWDGHPTNSAKGKGQLANTPQIAHHWVIGYDTISYMYCHRIFYMYTILYI